MQPFPLTAFYDIAFAVAAVLKVKPFVVMSSGRMCNRGNTCKTSNHEFPPTDELLSCTKSNCTKSSPSLFDDMVTVLQKLRIFSRDQEQQDRRLWASVDDLANITACLAQAQQMMVVLRAQNGRPCTDIVHVLKEQFDEYGTIAAAHRLPRLALGGLVLLILGEVEVGLVVEHVSQPR